MGRHPHAGLHVAVIDTAVANSPLSTSLLDELRAATRANPEHKFASTSLSRESRRGTHLEGTDLVMVDGNVLTRSALLKAVAIAAGRAKQPELEAAQRC
jgi:hypothetical protein